MKKEKLLEGIYKTYKHSKELFDDAEFLYENGKKERAYTFYHFAFEETGRFYFLLKVLSSYLSGKIEAKNLNSGLLKKIGYENHIKKLKASTLKMFITPVLNSQIDLDEIENWYNEIVKDIPKYNDNKNRSIYICIEDNDFKSPNEMITDENIWEMRNLAEISILSMENAIKSDFFSRIGDDLIEFRKQLIEEKINRDKILEE